MDTGLTVSYLVEHFKSQGARSVAVVAVLNKPGKRPPGGVEPDYWCFELLDDAFVVGYGMDYNEMYRSLPYVGVLCEEAIKRGGEEVLPEA